jgi:hypothetical protein
MKEETAEFVRKLRAVIRVVMWIWVIGCFFIAWYGHRPIPAHTEKLMGIKDDVTVLATGMDWNGFLSSWAVIGIAPALVLRVILYLMPGGKRKQVTPGDGSGGV